tara:strand:- start:1616 stop:2005 length:390 start_codon:yes stop_codon:yes gene_type:complete
MIKPIYIGGNSGFSYSGDMEWETIKKEDLYTHNHNMTEIIKQYPIRNSDYIYNHKPKAVVSISTKLNHPNLDPWNRELRPWIPCILPYENSSFYETYHEGPYGWVNIRSGYNLRWTTINKKAISFLHLI